MLMQRKLMQNGTIAMVISIILLLNVAIILYDYHLQMAIAAKGYNKKKIHHENSANDKKNPSSTTSTTQSSTASSSLSNGSTINTIQLSVKEKKGVYTWSNSSNDAINPTLKFVVSSNKTIQIQNPTDTKHEFIIGFNGKELATSGDIRPGKSGELVFKPNMTGTLEYHCQYHPTTMKGIVNVAALR
jgi:plastocyanin